ncbi:hypothetical protein CFC21_007227 [Triticum aestivum]|uniref:Uncharacterized protein n=3 Tax=Triticum TaxID=4564 RepID=A0A9R0XLK7_TRITD|nr:uncharacterized protein LOC119312431 [Triticum dicoccoides]XP_044391161.1 uncharacterized protein LOC123113906 [Triticum aestivum]KAF6989963.1 hypothetical protein CFC21_007227 [Triticum aestivum]VAI38801.1 unnamed protein product [Triticum turgidum subsp. durum]
MALRVAPSPLLASGGGATAFTTPLTPKKRGAGLLLLSKRSRISAQLGGGGGGDGETKPDGKKFITREQEPEQYWQTAGERKGENPMMTPLPYIVIFGFSTPFIILAIAFANGWIKAPLIR